MLRCGLASCLILSLSSCGSSLSASDNDSSASGETGSCASGVPYVEVTNQTPWTMAALTYTPCGSQGSDNFPFPTPGLEPGETLVVPLPESGCYILGVIEPNACSIDMAPQTGELAPCETYEMVLDEDQFICPGN